jgi:hypothetical protein
MYFHPLNPSTIPALAYSLVWIEGPVRLIEIRELQGKTPPSVSFFAIGALDE